MLILHWLFVELHVCGCSISIFNLVKESHSKEKFKVGASCVAVHLVLLFFPIIFFQSNNWSLKIHETDAQMVAIPVVSYQVLFSELQGKPLFSCQAQGRKDFT